VLQGILTYKVILISYLIIIKVSYNTWYLIKVSCPARYLIQLTSSISETIAWRGFLSQVLPDEFFSAQFELGFELGFELDLLFHFVVCFVNFFSLSSTIVKNKLRVFVDGTTLQLSLIFVGGLEALTWWSSVPLR
jgi:hypothetical protein